MLSKGILSIIARYRVPHIMYLFELEHKTRNIKHALLMYDNVKQKEYVIATLYMGNWTILSECYKERSLITNLGKHTLYRFNYYTGKSTKITQY